MKAILFVLFAVFVFKPIQAQDSSSLKKQPVTISFYADLYYQFNANKTVNKLLPDGIYNFKRHQRVSSNLTLLKATFNVGKWYANTALMVGDYATFNLATEPSFFSYINEANIGYQLSSSLSIEAGIMPSHIGFESAIAKDNWNLSRSLLAENSPYYETGIKLNKAFNSKWSLSILLLNGWQNIKENNRSKAVGTQLQYKPSDKWVLQSATFLGQEKPSDAKQTRVFHNFYGTYLLNPKTKLALLFDVGKEQQLNSGKWNTWFGAAALCKHHLNADLSVAGRVELYNDTKGVIVTNYVPNPFIVTGYALNVDYQIAKYLQIRTEARLLSATENIFQHNNTPTQKNFSLLTALAVFF